MIQKHLNELMPASLESERGLLCSFCLNSSAVGALMAELGIGPDHFTTPLLSSLCEKMQARWNEGRPITMRLMMKDMEDGQDGAIFASEVLTHISTPAYVEEYAQKVLEKWQLRQILLETAAIHENAWSPLADPAALLESIAKLSGIAAARAKEATFKSLLQEKLRRMNEGEPDADRLETGITLLDRQSPLRLGNMPLISGERKAGKSIFSLSVVSNVIMRGRAAQYFSLEDDRNTVVDRIFAGISRVPIENHHRERMSAAEMQRITAAFEELITKRFFIHDDIQDIGAICAAIRQRKARTPDLALVVLDYAQIVKARMAKGATREQEVAFVSRSIRLLALELKVAIIVLCQLNKDGDTRDSKSLEQDCTAMWKLEPTPDDDSNRRLIVIPFQRNGDSNIAFPVTFFGHIARVENLSNEQP